MNFRWNLWIRLLAVFFLFLFLCSPSLAQLSSAIERDTDNKLGRLTPVEIDALDKLSGRTAKVPTKAPRHNQCNRKHQREQHQTDGARQLEVAVIDKAENSRKAD